MPRVIVIVARDRPELLAYFEHVFADMPDIKVLLDRRLIPPGMQGGSSNPGHRERRDIYDELQQRGFVMIRLR
jgi:hypothetical protein